MTDTLYIPTTSTVMRGAECILQLDVEVEVDCSDGTDFEIAAFWLDDRNMIGKADAHLFALLSEGIDKRDFAERVQAHYKWEQDRETGFLICKGLAA